MIDAADFLKWLEIYKVQFGSSIIPIPVPLSYGGTGANLTASNHSLVYSTSTALALLATNPSSLLVTDSGGAPSLSTVLPGSLTTSDPTLVQGIATKHYVDQTALTGTSVYAATTTNLNVTQSGAGVGATITDASGTFAPLTLDGVAVPLNQPFLAKNLAAPQHEGIYTLTTNGDGVSIPWQGTRSVTYDTPSEINNTGLIIIQNGSTQAGEAWYNVSTIVTVDTTAFNYNQFGNITFPITLNHGGTNANLTASNGGIVYSTASAMAILAGTATARQMLQSGASGAPAWSTATYPATTTINQLLYSSANNVISGLSTLINGVLVTDNSGVPELLANGSAGMVLTANAGAPPSWETLAFDGAITQVNGDLGNGTPSGGILTISGGSTGLQTSGSVSTVTIVGTLNLASGGTNASLTANNGGIVYSTATAMAILSGTATANQILMSGAASAPSWSTATYPVTAGTLANVLTSDGTNWISSAPAASLTSVIADDTTTNATMYPLWVTAASGSLPLKVSSTKISFNPFTGNLGLSGYLSGSPGVSSSAGAIMLNFGYIAGAVNFWQILNNATTFDPVLEVTGSDSSVSMQLQSKGGIFKFGDGTSTSSGNLRLQNALSNHYTGLTVATNQSTDLNLTLPALDGSNGSILQTNGSGILSFSIPAYPSTSGTARKLIISDGTNNVYSTETWAVPGTSGNVLTSDGTNWISAVPASTSLLTTKGDLFSFSTVDARLPVATGDGKVLQVSSGAATGLAYSTPTYPSTSGSAGKILRSDGTNNVYTTSTFADTYSASVLLYSNGANTVTGLATANSSGLLTNSLGVPSWVTVTGTGAPVLATSPSLVTPTLGAANATSINFGDTSLANYKQATFTPTLVSSGGGTATYNVQSGTYTRIGNRILFNLFLNLTGLPSAGNLTISGLPNAAASYGAASVTTASLGATAITEIQCQIVSGSTSLTLFKYAAGTQSFLTVGDITSTSQFIISGQYDI